MVVGAVVAVVGAFHLATIEPDDYQYTYVFVYRNFVEKIN